jgi:hypothetical protein
MKFLVFMTLIIMSLNVYSQSLADFPSNTSTSQFGSRTWELIKSKLQIRYFSETMGPSITKGGDRQVEWDKNNNYSQGQDPIGVFNQVSLNWAMNKQWAFVVQPRFTYRFGDTEGYAKNQDRGPFQMEDTRTAVQGVYWSNADESMTLFVRAGVRLPTDKNGQNSNTYLQPEISNFFDWTINKKWAVFVWQSFRTYFYHSSSTQERWRFYNAPGVTYTFNDKWQFVAFYENEISHNLPRPGVKKLNYAVSNYEDVYLGPQYVVNSSLTLYPFLRPSQLKKPSLETTAAGLWVMARVF